MSEMVPLPPEKEESERPVWVIPLGIVSAVLVVALVAYLVWGSVSGLPGSASSILSFLSRSPSSEETIAPRLVEGTATAAPIEATLLPTATPSPTLKAPTATPTAMATEPPSPTATPPIPEATDPPPEGEGSGEMPPTGFGPTYLIPIAMVLAVVLLLARVLRIRYQG